MHVQSGLIDRREVAHLLDADLRDLTTQMGRASREFRHCNDLSDNDVRALLFVVIAEERGERLTAGDLRRQMGLSGAAITYLVDRMTATGDLCRHRDPADRRIVLLRCGEHAKPMLQAFLCGLQTSVHEALACVSDEDLAAAHRTLVATIEAMKAYRAAMSETG